MSNRDETNSDLDNGESDYETAPEDPEEPAPLQGDGGVQEVPAAGGPAITQSHPPNEAPAPHTVPDHDVAVKSEITIVLAGKSGAGKSTLLKNVFGEKPDTGMSASPKTKNPKTYEVKENDITISIVDTVGLMENDSKKQLENLSEHVSGEADLLLYCLPISQSSRFDDSNPAIMKYLQNAYGKDIWQHCMVVLTFSNLAWNHIQESENEETGETNHEAVIAKYKRYIAEYIDRFRQQLAELGVQNMQVASVFDDNFDPNAGTGDVPTIVVVPAGYKPTDEVLAGLPYRIQPSQALKNAIDFTTHSAPAATNEQEDRLTNDENWKANLVYLMLKRCKPECSMALLQFWYGRKRIGTTLREQSVKAGLGGGAAGGMAAGAAGVAAGAVLGVAGGPIGVPIGAALGLVTGVLVGTLVGGGSSAGAATIVGHVLHKTANKTE